jgi:DNA-binding MarR family transcriptional regulator
MSTDGATPVNKVRGPDIINRPPLSPMQREILAVLQPAPGGSSLRGMPGTGEIITAIGRQRDPKHFASVSRSLARLVKAGLVVAWHAELCLPGRGSRYALTEAGAQIKAEIFADAA